MRRKLTERQIETLNFFSFIFIAISCAISLCIALFQFFIPVNGVILLQSNYVALVALINFLICICFILSFSNNSSYVLAFLRKRNDKIDEEEKARQQALLLETEERNRANSQIWVNE